jgi:hypothetical protein
MKADHNKTSLNQLGWLCKTAKPAPYQGRKGLRLEQGTTSGVHHLKGAPRHGADAWVSKEDKTFTTIVWEGSGFSIVLLQY